MEQVIRWILLSVLGWLGAVKSIQQPHTACQTLHTIIQKKLHINCNSDEIVYVNQVTLNDLGKDSNYIVHNNSECQKTSDPACFRSIPSDIPWNYTFYRKISKICNGNHNCTLEDSDLTLYVTQFRDQTTCSDSRVFFYYTRIGFIFECFLSKGQVLVGKNITETRDGSLYVASIESGQCLIRGSIESARILEQVNMTFTVRDRKSRLCTEVVTNGSFNYNEDLSCLRDVNEFLLDIQTMDTLRGKLWIEFKGTSLQVKCGNNIQLRVVQDSEQNGGSTLLPVIIGLVAGLLLLLVLILVVLKKRHDLTIKTEAKHRPIIATTTLEGDQDRTYYNNDVDKPRNDVNDVQGTSSSFDESFYNTVDTDGNYAQIYPKKNTSESGINNGEHNIKNEMNDTEKSRKKSRDSDIVTPVSSNTAENKPNTIIGEVTGDVYAAVCKTDDLKSMRITGPKGDIYTTVSMASNVE